VREIGSGVVGFSRFYSQLGERFDFFDGLLEGGFAVGLELTEHGDVLFHAALDSGRVESDPFEAFVVSEPGAALGEGGDGFIVFGIGLEGDVVESEDGVFDGDGALQLPAAVGDGLDKAGFESAGLETFRPSPRFRRVSEMAVLRRSPFKMH